MQDGSLKVKVGFPRLRVGTFIEAQAVPVCLNDLLSDFFAFGWGLSLRRPRRVPLAGAAWHFPAFGRGLSLRRNGQDRLASGASRFPCLRAGTFIEALSPPVKSPPSTRISPPSGGDFH